MKIFHSPDPENPSGKGGIAVVLNWNLINVQGSKISVIIPGRAILVTLNWHKSKVLNLLAIYEPNITESNGEENREFWTTLRSFFLTNPRTKVDIMAGDFNMVEDVQDRAPSREDPVEATEALDNLKQTLYLRNSWRDAFPTKRLFTYIQDVTASMSRIDRIYMTDTITISIKNWSILPTSISGMDNQLMTVQISHTDAPAMGKGRWTLKGHII